MSIYQCHEVPTSHMATLSSIHDGRQVGDYDDGRQVGDYDDGRQVGDYDDGRQGVIMMMAGRWVIMKVFYTITQNYFAMTDCKY